MRVSTYISFLLPIIAVCAHPLPDKLSASRNVQVPRDLTGCDSLECLIARNLHDVGDIGLYARGGGGKGGKVPPPRQAKTPSKPPTVKSDLPVAPRPPKPSNKITQEEQTARKDAARTKMENRQRYNDRSRAPLSPEAAKQRDDNIAAKAKVSQQQANDRAQQRKQAGRDKMADTVSAYKATTNLPNRKKVFNVNENIDGKVQTVKYTGADARTAVFNTHLHKDDKVNFQPKTFENRLQGPKDDKSRPIPSMKGKAAEFPLSQNPGGYKGEKPGAARVIVQPTDSGHKFVGVVAHDASLGQDHPGHNDHFQVKSSNK